MGDLNPNLTPNLQADWLGSQPLFYDERDGRTSTNINDLIDPSDFEFDPEGLYNYIDFGYSVFGRTPIRHIRFLEANCDLVWDHDLRAISVYRRPDPALDWLGRSTKESEVWDLLESRVKELDEGWNEIIIPTSGGYDSRVLNLFWPRRESIRTFTYGVSASQEVSYEVVFAKKLSQLLGTHWQQIDLGDYHQFLADWYDLYGVSTHAHGMYQIEFYKRIAEETTGRTVLSGIVGDAWAGSVPFVPIKGPADLSKLGYSHGLRADPAQLTVKKYTDDRERFMSENDLLIKDKALQAVLLVRLKISLLSYLLRVPQALGFETRTPFLNEDLALSMTCLPASRRLNRRWQAEFFRTAGLDLEHMGLKADYRNILVKTAITKSPPPLLNSALLREILNPKYVDWINANLGRPTKMAVSSMASSRTKEMVKAGLAFAPPLMYVLRRLSRASDRQLRAYSAYQTLLPIQYLLEQRQQRRGI